MGADGNDGPSAPGLHFGLQFFFSWVDIIRCGDLRKTHGDVFHEFGAAEILIAIICWLNVCVKAKWFRVWTVSRVWLFRPSPLPGAKDEKC